MKNWKIALMRIVSILISIATIAVWVGVHLYLWRVINEINIK